MPERSAFFRQVEMYHGPKTEANRNTAGPKYIPGSTKGKLRVPLLLSSIDRIITSKGRKHRTNGEERKEGY